MSDLKINNITDRTGDSGPVIAGVSTVSSTGAFTVPVGATEYRGGRGRSVRAGGRISPAQRREMDYVEIATTGNATSFGELSIQSGYNSGASSATRGLVQLGGAPASNAYSAVLDYYTFSSKGGVNDFGSLTTAWFNGIGFSSSTRGAFAGGRTSPGVNNNSIEYVTIATTGNASDFGDYTKARGGMASCASLTRGVFGGGYTDPAYETQWTDIQYVTIASKGDAKDFGELFTGRYRFYGCSNTTRGLFMGGAYTSSAPNTISSLNTIDYVTIASLGNATDFGDLTRLTAGNAASASATRGLCMGGYGPSTVNTIDYVTIASTGNATDFGDMTQVIFDCCASSDVHGGLG